MGFLESDGFPSEVLYCVRRLASKVPFEQSLAKCTRTVVIVPGKVSRLRCCNSSLATSSVRARELDKNALISLVRYCDIGVLMRWSSCRVADEATNTSLRSTERARMLIIVLPSFSFFLIASRHCVFDEPRICNSQRVHLITGTRSHNIPLQDGISSIISGLLYPGNLTPFLGNSCPLAQRKNRVFCSNMAAA